MKRVSLGATFIDSLKGRILLTWRRPDSPRGFVLVIPPFAEEMNKCRSLIADVAVQLAADGLATVVPDLYGTGDSEGEFGEADWNIWVADVRNAVRWAHESIAPLHGFLAIRLGASLCLSLLKYGDVPAVTDTVLWQPVLDTKRHLLQFLRLRTAASLTQSGKRENAEDVLHGLRSGHGVEVAGYRLNPDLAQQMEKNPTAMLLPPLLGKVTWIEVQRAREAAPTPVTQRILDASASAGANVKYEPVTGPPFWNSTEILRIPELKQATVAGFS